MSAAIACMLHILFNEATRYTDRKQLLLSTASATTDHIPYVVGISAKKSHHSWFPRLFCLDWTTAIHCWPVYYAPPSNHYENNSCRMKLSCPSGAQSRLPWSRDTSASAAALATCWAQNHVQVVCIDASGGWTCVHSIIWYYAIIADCSVMLAQLRATLSGNTNINRFKSLSEKDE